MNRELKIILVKFILITVSILAFTFIMAWVVSPYLVQQVYGQSAFDTPNQYNPDPYNQQFNQQYQQPYMDPYQQQFQQPYQQYGTPYQQPYYGQQPYPQPQNPIQFGTSEIIYTLLGGGAIGYGRYNQHKRNQDKEVQRELAAELLKEKLEKREFARVAYQQMPNEGNDIKDAPNIRLQKLDSDIEQLSEKVSKI